MSRPAPRDLRTALTFRAARASDQPAIAAMTSAVWEGEDYLAEVWPKWVEQSGALLRVGLLAGEIVTTGRVVALAEGEWWMEGIRVAPEEQGRGLATRIFRHLVSLAAQQPAARTLGLATSGATRAIHHLARASGMTREGRYRLLKGRPLAEPAPGAERVHLDAQPLLARLQGSCWLQQSGGHAMDGWVTRRVTAGWLAPLLATGNLWRCGDALALVDVGADKGRAWLHLLAGGSAAEQEALVRHARHLAQQHGAPWLRCFVPDSPALLAPLLAAGMGDPWGGDEGPFHLFHFARSIAQDTTGATA